MKPEVPTTGPPNKFSTIPSSVSRLDTKYYTLAEMCKDNGYATGHFGKWHLGPEPYSPLEHGFNVDVPHHPGPGPAGSYVAPWKFKDFDHDPLIPDEHLEDRMAKEAVAFMEQHKDEPFFLNYWMFSVHAPFDAKQSLIDEYRKKVDPNDPQRSPTYAAMVESMDDAVGTLLDTLDRLGVADNTIIIFASDNGGNMYNLVDGGTATSNAPLKGGKATMYEGGVRGPAIFVEPGVIKAGSRSDEIIQSSDFYPTLLEMLSIKPQPNQYFDGVSIVPALQGGKLQRDAIFTYFPHSPGIPDWLPPAVSVHAGDWKLIRIFHGGENGKHRYKLFNLKADIGEEHNLADQMPERVQQLDALIEQHLVETQAVRPLPNPNFDPSKYDESAEGIASLKGSADKQKTEKTKPPSKPVAGWQAGGSCTLSIGDSALLINSSGRDPWLSHRLPQAIDGKSYTMHITMISASSGNGQVFWQEQDAGRFKAERSQFFDVRHDGEQHEYAVHFTTKSSLVAVRIDPSRGTGKIEVSDIRLVGEDDTTLYHLKLPAMPAVSASSSRGRQPNVIVIFTDDHGYADLSCQGVFSDVKTPNMDALARGGVRMTDGYCTAPQFVPSRGGLISGQYQTTWGLESNPQFKDAATMQRFDELVTIPERLQRAGYVTGMAGKWHLGPSKADAIAGHGFDKVFHKNSNRPGHWNMKLEGEDLEPQEQKGGGYHIDMISEFACSFIDRFSDKPFFFYLACRAPHVPLDAPQKYLDRFPGEMPQRRRQALAMLSAVDDGVGQILATLRKHELEEDTLTCSARTYFSSLLKNTPFRWYKSSAQEGGVSVPLIARWPTELAEQAGSIRKQRLHVTDLYPTFLELAGASYPATDGERELEPLYGASLLTLLRDSALPDRAIHDEIFWCFNQTGKGLVKGDWKISSISVGPWQLYKIPDDPAESRDLAAELPDVTAEMSERWFHFAENLTAMPADWRAPLHHYQEGWGFHRIRMAMPAFVRAVPASSAMNVPCDTDLSFHFSPSIRFAKSTGRAIRLYEACDIDTVVWQVDPEPGHPAEGRKQITFDDLPRLKPHTTYFVLSDKGWIAMNCKPAVELNDGAFRYRFRTGAN